MDTDKFKELCDLYYSFGDSKRKLSDVQSAFLQEILENYRIYGHYNDYCNIPCHFRGQLVGYTRDSEVFMCVACNDIVDVLSSDCDDSIKRCCICEGYPCGKHVEYYCKQYNKTICVKCIDDLPSCVMPACSGKLFIVQKYDENEDCDNWLLCTKCKYESPEDEVCTKSVKSV